MPVLCTDGAQDRGVRGEGTAGDLVLMPLQLFHHLTLTIFEVPHVQVFISGGTDQHQAHTTLVVYQIQQQCSSVNISDPDVQSGPQQQLLLSKLQRQQLFFSGTEQSNAKPWWAVGLLQLVTLDTLKQCKEMTKGPIKRPKNKIQLSLWA